MAELRCPMCSKSNPDTLEVCQFCSARLKPFVLPQTSALTLPTDWGQAVEAKSQDQKSAETPQSPRVSTDDWLGSLRGGVGSPESDPDSDAESDETLVAANSVDDWLAKLRAQDEADSEQPPQSDPVQATADDWLGSLRSLRSPSPELPSWLDDSPEPEAAPETPQPQSNWLDSLRGSADETIVARPPTQPEPSLPDWLSDSPPAQSPLPDWLSPSVADETIVSRPNDTRSSEPTATTSDSTLPDWLAPQPVPKKTASDLPNWLAASEASPAATLAAPPPQTDLPDWFGATKPDQPADDSSSSFPDWLSASGGSPDNAFATPTPQTDLPDWLTGGQPQPVNSAAAVSDSAESFTPHAELTAADQPLADLPAWMDAPSTPAPTESSSIRSAPAMPPTQPEPAQPHAVEGITDWLSSGGTDALPGSVKAGENRPLTTTGWLRSMPPAESKDNLDWLSKSSATSEPAADLPDWLSSAPTASTSQPAPDQPQAVEGITDWLSGDETVALPGSITDSENRPLSTTGWLRSMAPPESTDSLDWLSKSPAPPTAKPDPKALVGSTDWLAAKSKQEEIASTPAADIPDWLKGSTPAGSNPSVSGVTDWFTTPDSQPAAPAEPDPADKAVLGTTDWLSSIGLSQPPSTPTPAAATPKKTKTGWLTGPLKPSNEEPASPTSSPAKAVLGATDWLDTLAASAMSTTSGSAPLAPKAEIPDWLTPTETGQPSASDLPDWVTPGPAAVPSSTEPSSDSADTVIGTTDWLKTATVADKSNAPFVDTGALKDIRKNDVSDLDWLSALQPTSPSSAPAKASELLALPPTRTLKSQKETSSTPPAAPDSKPESGELPSWLAALRPTDLDLSTTDTESTLVTSLAAAPEPAAPTPTEVAEDLPKRIRPTTPTTSAADETILSKPGRRSPLPPSVPAFSTPVTMEVEDLAVANLPAWMRALRPLDARATAREPEPDREETAGPLAGMRGILPAESVISMAGRPGASVAGFILTEAHTKLADRLRRLIQEEATEDTDVKPHKKSGLNFDVWRVTIAIILFFVALLPMIAEVAAFLPAELFARPAVTAATTKFYNSVESLTAGQAVLVAIEYEPAQSGELNPAVESVLAHLFKHGMRVVTVSTSPTGAGIVDDLLIEAAKEAGGKERDKDYRNLGFIPGGPVGIRQFALNPVATLRTDFAGKDNPFEYLAGVNTIGNFQMVIVVSATVEGAQNWIQQAPSINSLTLISSAAAEPLLEPYTRGTPPQVKALWSGLSGALQYNEVSQRDPGKSNQVAIRWVSFAYGLYTIVGLLVMGSLIGGVAVLLSRRPKPTKKGAAKTKTRPVARAAAPEPTQTESPEPEPLAAEPAPTASAKPRTKTTATKSKPTKSNSAKKTPSGKTTATPAKAKPKPKQKALETRTSVRVAEPDVADKSARPRMRKV